MIGALAQVNKLRRVLLEDADGVEKFIQAPLHLTKQHAGNGHIASDADQLVIWLPV
ncbi:hypothetical protein [Sorangium sp. So ce1151]|uniref:hypothetical protein n=1 Tax=Sorangium sp. So ce1151 TaxID=3133332 RepID=UPI003F5F6E89